MTRIGDTFTWLIYGHEETVLLLEIHPFGTIDVERVRDGKCFRLTGLRIDRFHRVTA